jgi:hypothetical protein
METYDVADAFVEAESARIRNEDQWPHWPVLPMKKKIVGQAWPKLGIVVAGDLAIVYLRLLPELKAGVSLGMQLQGCPTIKYASVEEMVADGWMGD